MTDEKKNIDDPDATESNEANTGNDSDTNPEYTEYSGNQLGDRLSDVTDKGVQAVKSVFQRVSDLAGEASELTRLKLDLVKIKGQRDNAYVELGKKYYSLQKMDKVKGFKTTFGVDLERIDELEANISQKEEELERINFAEKLKGKTE